MQNNLVFFNAEGRVEEWIADLSKYSFSHQGHDNAPAITVVQRRLDENDVVLSLTRSELPVNEWVKEAYLGVLSVMGYGLVCQAICTLRCCVKQSRRYRLIRLW